MSYVINLASEIGRTDVSIGIQPVTAMRALLLCLTAFLTTAIWGVMLYFGAPALGIPIGAGWLAVTLAVIFLLLLLVLGMAAAASDGRDDGRFDPPPGL